MRPSKFTLITLLSCISVVSILAQSGNTLFNDQILHEIRFENIDTSSFFSFAKKGIYYQSKVIIDGTTIDSVGVTTKGNISWSHINNKKPLKVKLNKFVSAKKYDDVKEFLLHNSYEDPSLLREKLTYDICKQLGLHALRTAFAKVYINNVYWGVYTLIEGKDDLYKRVFNNRDAEVFETLDLGSPCVFNQTSPYWQVDNGTPAATWPRLKKMVDVLNNTPSSQYLDTVPKYFNMSDFLKYQALNVYLLNFDSYLQFNGNQLYLYDTLSKVFQIIPWDFNASFGLWNTNNYNPNTLDIIPSLISSRCPFNKINEFSKYKNTYLDAICMLKNTYCDTTTLNAKITKFYNLIKTAAYSDNRKQPTNAQFDKATGYGYQLYLNENVPGLKTFVNERWAKINKDINALPYVCSNSTSIKENALNTIQLFPNPAREAIQITGVPANSTIELLDISGRIVYSKSITSYEEKVSINISHIITGIYFCKIISNNGDLVVLKFVKE